MSGPHVKTTESLDASVLACLDQVCDGFEAAWNAGQRPRIEDYLQDTSSHLRAKLLRELLSLELIYRHRHGQTPTRAQYEGRFPEHVPLVRAVFEQFRQESLPRAFGKYELLTNLGGGMGVVYRARDKQLERIVAVKLIHARHVPSERRTRRFLAEAQAAAQLQHPHIVRVHGAGQIHGQHYIEMEFVDGCNLAERIHRHPMTAEKAARCLCAVSQAAHFLHSKGMVHRDLKPHNIMLDKDGNPHLADFGLARILDRKEEQGAGGTILGTASYMAPEQAEGRTEDVDERSDVYGLGAILYEMLTGLPPHRGRTVAEILVQVRESEPARPRHINAAVPRDLEAICLRCLEKNPHRRYASALDLAKDLEAFLRGEEVTARSPNTWRRARRWARRQPALASRLAALAVCFIVQLANFHVFRGMELPYHLKILGLLGVWIASAVAFQAMINRRRWSDYVRLAWCGSDVVFLTLLLRLVSKGATDPMVHGLATPLVIGYPLLIAGSGLWFRVSLVWFVTLMSAAAYILLVCLYWPVMDNVLQRHFTFTVILMAVVGVVVAFQVRRFQALERYYHQRPFP